MRIDILRRNGFGEVFPNKIDVAIGDFAKKSSIMFIERDA